MGEAGLRAGAAGGETSFRKDINGLRAWAVCAVVLFHFGVPGFAGGFVGVDVFFVISGFLMTGIVVDRLEAGMGPGFILQFYLARARRIVPALLALVLALMLAGWVALPTTDYKKLALHAALSLAFLSNIKFWLEAGYFDAVSHEKWLLHTWSLSVEWQFYLLLPVVLFAVWRLSPDRRAVVACMAVALIGSLALSAFLTPRSPPAAFYLLPTRAWEMLAGGMVFFMQDADKRAGRWRVVLELAGLMMIVASIVAYDGTTVWPGWHAVLPVAGTALVVLAGRQRSMLTGNGVAQWLGTSSYSIYLWHWPVVVLLGYLQRRGDVVAISSGIFVTLLLGWLSYRLVEDTARRRMTRMRPRVAAAVLASALLLVLCSSLAVRFLQGIPARLPADVRRIDALGGDMNHRQQGCGAAAGGEFAVCPYGGQQVSGLVLGDSHAMAMITAVQAALPDASQGIVDFVQEACPTMFGARRVDGQNRCNDFNKWAFDRISEYPADVPLVIINRASNYAYGRNEDIGPDAHTPLVFFSKKYDVATAAFLDEYGRHLVETACRYAERRPVYLVRPVPELRRNVPAVMARTRLWGHEERVSISLDEYRTRNSIVWAAQDRAAASCGVKILDPLPYFCDAVECHGDIRGVPVYFDDNHLSESGNKVLVPMFSVIPFRRPAVPERAAPAGRG